MKIKAATDGNWSDQLGKTQYGGTMTLPINSDIMIFDPYDFPLRVNIMSAWLETLHVEAWTLDPAGSMTGHKEPSGRKMGICGPKHLCCPSA